MAKQENKILPKIFQKMLPDDYISDTFLIAEDFFNAYSALRKTENYRHLMVLGFLAARSAELYIKCLVIEHTESVKYFDEFRKIKHNLKNLLNLLIVLDPSSKNLQKAIDSLSKYEADKVVYAESLYREGSPSLFGTNETDQVIQVRQFAKDYLKW